MRSTLSLFLLLSLISCGKNGGSSTEEELSSATYLSTEVPENALTFEIDAKLDGFTRNQEDKILKAFELIKKVVASEQFKKRILEKRYDGKKQYVDNNGLSNEQIYQKLLEGSEIFNKERDNTMDLFLAEYFTSANVIGYTKPSIQTIYLNTKYLNNENFTEAQVAMNITHEWLHKIGFTHSFERTPEREHSVPYAVGYIMRELATRMN